MKKVLIYVEGQTEETFVREVLAPHLWQKCHLQSVPTLARTKRTKAGQTFKGGIVSYPQVQRDILRLLNDSSATLVTTMMDYYGLPDDFPGKSTLPSGTPYQRVHHMEAAFKNAIEAHRFLPFLVLHEFEALVLTDPNRLVKVLPQYKGAFHRFQQEISGLRPEEINDGKNTHPAARIKQHFPGYRKRLHGSLIVKQIGVVTLRRSCPHFDEWLRHLERLCEQE